MNKKLKTTWTVLNQNVFIVISIIYKNWCEKSHADLTVRSFSQQSGTFDPYSINYTTLILYLLNYTSMGTQRCPSYSNFLPPFTRTKFSLLKSNHSTKNLKIKLRTFPWISRVPQSKFEANLTRGFRVMIGQTSRDNNFIYVDR